MSELFQYYDAPHSTRRQTKRLGSTQRGMRATSTKEEQNQNAKDISNIATVLYRHVLQADNKIDTFILGVRKHCLVHRFRILWFIALFCDSGRLSDYSSFCDRLKRLDNRYIA